MTTTDDFTTAASDLGVDPEEVRSSVGNAFAHHLKIGMSHEVLLMWLWHAGAIYGRDHLALQEPTDAEKDAAMDALGCELRVVENGQSTCDLHGGYATSDDVCEVVEVALSAARAARRDEEKR